MVPILTMQAESAQAPTRVAANHVYIYIYIYVYTYIHIYIYIYICITLDDCMLLL